MPSSKPAASRRAAIAIGSGLAMAAFSAAGWSAAAVAAGPAVTLPGEVLSGLNHATDGGAVAGNRFVSLGVSLSRPNPAGESALIQGEYTPGSPLYHRFLSPAQFNAQFGVPASRTAAVASWLQAGGLSVQTIAGTTDYLTAGGSAAQVQALLGVHLHNFTNKGSGPFFANIDNPTVPAALGIAGIAGLNSLEHPLLQPKHNVKPTVPAFKPGVVGPNTNTGLSTPPVLWDVYNQPAGNKGQGQQLAIFGWGTTNNTLSDLRAFETEYKLPAIPLSTTYYGPEPAITDSGGEPEWDIDTQASSGMAPDATALKLYFGKAGTDPDLIAAYNGWVNDPNGPLQGSSSFSGCEQAPGTDGFTGGPGSPSGLLIFGNPNQDQYTAALKQAVAEGRTMFASTGDTGAGCPAVSLVLNGVTLVPTPMMGFPAVSPYAVGVGGTVLYYDGGTGGTKATRALEYPWNYTGGGTSLFLKAGDYQNLIPPILLFQCAVDNHGTPYVPPLPLCRGIPDVAAQSGDIATNGYTVTMSGTNDSSGGGTSLSSPLWLGMWARVQAASAFAGGNGFANPAIYKDAVANPSDFFDIGGLSTETAPNCNGPNPYNCAHPGWDYVSGWGTPDVAQLMQHLDGKLTPTNNTTPNPPPTAGGSGGQPPSTNGGTTCPGPQIIDPSGDAPDTYPGGSGEQQPNLDILHVQFASPNKTTLQITMAVNDLEPPANEIGEKYPSATWNVYWTYNAQAYIAQATVDGANPAATWKFTDGTGTSAFKPVTGTATTGVYTGSGAAGTLVWNIPLADIGNPQPGQHLTSTHADTHGSFTVNGTGLHYVAAADTAPDKGFGADWQIGTDCSGGGGTPPPVMPEAPVTALLLVGGGLAGGLELWRRRRRSPGITSVN